MLLTDCTRPVLPRDWEMLDPITYPTYNQLFSNQREGNLCLSAKKSPLVQKEHEHFVFGGCHASWVDHDGVVVSADIIEEIELHGPVPQNATNPHLFFSTPWSPTGVDGQINMRPVR